MLGLPNGTLFLWAKRLLLLLHSKTGTLLLRLFFSFLPCLTAGLAYYIALKYAPERTQVLKLVYEEEFRRAADTNRENVSSRFVPKVGLVGGGY